MNKIDVCLSLALEISNIAMPHIRQDNKNRPTHMLCCGGPFFVLANVVENTKFLQPPNTLLYLSAALSALCLSGMHSWPPGSREGDWASFRAILMPPLRTLSAGERGGSGKLHVKAKKHIQLPDICSNFAPAWRSRMHARQTQSAQSRGQIL